MPIYIYRREECRFGIVGLTFFLEKDDYYCGEHVSARVCLTG